MNCTSDTVERSKHTQLPLKIKKYEYEWLKLEQRHGRKKSKAKPLHIIIY